MSAFEKYETAWCPGCGNHMILDTLKNILEELSLDPSKILLAAGIGQAAKTPQYLNTNNFCGLHGRSLPAAQAAKIANTELTVIVDTGDGDSYGEGGNHFLHAIRRNVDITHFVHDNQVYGLTKGQVSPTTDACLSQDDPHVCNRIEPFNPMAVAIAAGATFVARSFSGDKAHLAEMMKQAIKHKGYALVDILQPCVSFNKVNTFKYYKEHTYKLDAAYDKTDKITALSTVLKNDGKIPLGILYQSNAPEFCANNTILSKGTPLTNLKTDPVKLQHLLDSFV
ncbi:MAG: 2-oxoacid:ferredoxin oxidoreductase subunit beta [Eubacterium sp.]